MNTGNDSRDCASCPHHQISESLLIQYFYEGLTMRDRSMIDAASGGALVDKTLIEARTLIANMAANSQQFGDRHETPIRRVNEVGINSHMQKQLATLTSLVQPMAMRDNLPRPWGVCSIVGHMTDMCPSLQEGGSYEQANALGGF